MKVKDILKGVKYITHIFVYKENAEMQIGCPTDVKHIAHIGWDSSSMHGPTWMNEFSSGHSVPSMTLTSKYHDSIGLPMNSSLASGDFDQHGGVGILPATNTIATRPYRPDIPKTSKKNRKRKKTTKVPSPPASRTSSRSSRSLESFTSAFEEADQVCT